jgi:hypothetical protein
MHKNQLKRFTCNNEGLAYLEFAITLPLLLLLFLGAVEVTRYIIIAQKVEKATTTVSDVVAQSSTIGAAELDKLMQAVKQVMRPYVFNTNGYVILSSVTKSGNNPPVVSWQYTGGGTWVHSSQVGVQGSPALWVPFALSDKENIIIAEVYYDFKPILANSVIPSKTIYKTAVFRPRLGALGSLGS